MGAAASTWLLGVFTLLLSILPTDRFSVSGWLFQLPQTILVLPELHFTFKLDLLCCHLSSLQLFSLIKLMRAFNSGPLYSTRMFSVMNLLHFMALSLCADRKPSRFGGLHPPCGVGFGLFGSCLKNSGGQNCCEWFVMKHLICIISASFFIPFKVNCFEGRSCGVVEKAKTVF